MKITNMKELCKYAEKKKKDRKHHHNSILEVYGECSGMGSKYYKLPQKKVFSKRYFTR